MMIKKLILFLVFITTIKLFCQKNWDRVYFYENIQLFNQNHDIDSVNIGIKMKSKDEDLIESYLTEYNLQSETSKLSYYFNNLGIIDSFKTQGEKVGAEYDSFGNLTSGVIQLIDFAGRCDLLLKFHIVNQYDPQQRLIVAHSQDSLMWIKRVYSEDSISEWREFHRIKYMDSNNFIFHPDPVINCAANFHSFFGWHSAGYFYKETNYYYQGQLRKKITSAKYSPNRYEWNYRYDKRGRLVEVIISESTSKIVYFIKKIHYDLLGRINGITIIYPHNMIHQLKYRKRSDVIIEKIDFLDVTPEVKDAQRKSRFKIIYELYR